MVGHAPRLPGQTRESLVMLAGYPPTPTIEANGQALTING